MGALPAGYRMSRPTFARIAGACSNAGGSAGSVVKSLIRGTPRPRDASMTKTNAITIATPPPTPSPRPRTPRMSAASAAMSPASPPGANRANPASAGTTRSQASTGPRTNATAAIMPRRLIVPPYRSVLVNALLAPAPLLLAQDELLHLPGRRLRERTEDDRLRTLEVREHRPAVRDDVRLAHDPSVLRHDQRLRHLAPIPVRHCDDRDLEHVGMTRDGLLDLDGRDVLAARDDDVLLPVAQLDVPVGMQHGDVARVEPAAAERVLGGLGIGEVALHDVVPAHHDLAHRVGVGRDIAHLGIDHAELARDDVREALAGAEAGTRVGVAGVPLGMPVAERVRPVRLGEAVDVRDLRAEALPLREERRRRRRAAGRDAERPRQASGGRVGMVREHDEDGRRTVEVRDALLRNQAPDDGWIDPAEQDVAGSDAGDGPGKAPAVAVEERERPEEDGPRVHAISDDLRERVQVGAAVRVHDALRTSRRAGGVVDRVGLLLVGHAAGE